MVKNLTALHFERQEGDKSEEKRSRDPGCFLDLMGFDQKLFDDEEQESCQSSGQRHLDNIRGEFCQEAGSADSAHHQGCITDFKLSAHSTWNALSEVADLIEPKSTNRADFIKECQSGALDNVLVAYRTFGSVEITGLWDEGLPYLHHPTITYS